MDNLLPYKSDTVFFFFLYWSIIDLEDQFQVDNIVIQ